VISWIGECAVIFRLPSPPFLFICFLQFRSLKHSHNPPPKAILTLFLPCMFQLSMALFALHLLFCYTPQTLPASLVLFFTWMMQPPLAKNPLGHFPFRDAENPPHGVPFVQKQPFCCFPMVFGFLFYGPSSPEKVPRYGSCFRGPILLLRAQDRLLFFFFFPKGHSTLIFTFNRETLCFPFFPGHSSIISFVFWSRKSHPHVNFGWNFTSTPVWFRFSPGHLFVLLYPWCCSS